VEQHGAARQGAGELRPEKIEAEELMAKRHMAEAVGAEELGAPVGDEVAGGHATTPLNFGTGHVSLGARPGPGPPAPALVP
jgi:hypothetical protein